MKVLNLYAGIGGNRKLWEDVEVTAVEKDPEIAEVYRHYFPNDELIVGDAHQYLLEHYKEFENGFIWSSRPCVTHTRMNVNFNRVRYPDFGLYEEIVFLNTWHKGKFTAENVIPYYGNEGLGIPGVPVQQYHRHLFWCNFKIRTTDKSNPPKQIANIEAQKTKKKRHFGGHYNNGDIMTLKKSVPRFGFDLSDVSFTASRKDAVLRNCVDPEIGLMILNCARNIITKQNVNQLDFFE